MSLGNWSRLATGAVLVFALAACGGGGGAGGSSGSNSSNSPPHFTSPTSFTFDENVPVQFGLAVEDPDGDEITIRDETGGDGALFTVDLSTGRVTATTSNAAFDFEHPLDVDQNNVYEQNITLSDGKVSVRTTIKVTIVDVDEPPDFTSPQTLELNENQTGPVFTFTAEDPEGGSVSGYRLVQVSKLGEAVNSERLLAAFSIDAGTGVLSVVTPFDAEVDGTQDPINVVVEASDGKLVGSGGVNIALIDQPARAVKGAAISGIGQFSPLGDYAHNLGDIDGDGLEEIWINQRVEEGFAEPVNETAYLVWGKALRDLLADGSANLSIADLTAEQAITFTNETYESFGTKRSLLVGMPAGDVDGDGIPDIVVGFREMREVRDVTDTEDGPVAAIVFGKALTNNTSGEYNLLSPPALAQVDVSGVSRREALGLSVGYGDFDGDGLGDVVLGSPETVTARVIFGEVAAARKVTGDLDLQLTASGEALLLKHVYTGEHGATYTDMIGLGVAGLHDITGDGRDELIVSGTQLGPEDSNGVRWNDNGILVISGTILNDAKAAMTSEVNLADPSIEDSVVTLTSQALEISGIATNGDIDADGLADIALAHERAYGNGRIGTVIFGATLKSALSLGTDPSLDFTDPTEGVTVTLNSDSESDVEPWYIGRGDFFYPRYGQTLISATFAKNFIDGAGDELVLGQAMYTPLQRWQAGAVFVLRDGAISNAASAAVDISDDLGLLAAGRKFQGVAVNSALGASTFATDLDGDGIVDLSMASETAGPKPTSSIHPFGAYYMLPGSVMQEAFVSDSPNDDMALSLANESSSN